MNFRKYSIIAIAAAITSACGGGGDDAPELPPLSTEASLTTTTHSTGCVAKPGDSGWQKVDITVTRTPFATRGTVALDMRVFSDAACAEQKRRVYLKGPADWSGGPKTMKMGTGTKIGAKGTFAPVDATLSGVTLNFIPTAVKLPFVLVDEGDRLYFGTGKRESDGYPSEISPTPAVKI